jgi:hypothetical protein
LQETLTFVIPSTSGKLQFNWTSTGASGGTTSVQSTVVVPAANGETIGVRVTLNASTGDVKFYISTDDGVTWTQLGATVTGSATSIFGAGTMPLTVGQAGATASPLAGTIRRVEVRDGIDGTIVANPDFAGDPTNGDSVGNIWEVHGSESSYVYTPPSLHGYAKLDGSNQPFTGDVTVGTTGVDARVNLTRGFDGSTIGHIGIDLDSVGEGAAPYLMEIRNTSGTGELRLNQSGVSNPQGMTFYTTNVKRMAITPSGDVNIGEAVGAATTMDVPDEDGAGTQEVRALTYPATITAGGHGTFNGVTVSAGYDINAEHAAGDTNTRYGVGALNPSATGTSNVAIGYDVLKSLTTTSGHTGVGFKSLNAVTINHGNTALGRYSGHSTTGGRGVFLGDFSGMYATTQSLELFINSLDRTDRAGDVTKSIIYGKQAADVADQKLTFNADVTANSVTIPNQSEPPTPTGGGTMFVQDGALKFIGSAGTITTIGQA